MKSLKEILISESRRFKGFVYSTWPYSCGLTEALSHAGSAILAHEPQVEREDTKTNIILKGRKGTRSRPLKITLWTA